MELGKFVQALCILFGLIITISKASGGGCSCGEWNPKRKRIVDGLEISDHEYPMMAGIVNYVEKYTFCGGLVITEKHVLTAAHCIRKFKDRMNLLGVVVGEDSLQAIRDANNATTQIYRVEKAVIHPKYQDRQQDYDIAIAESAEKFKLKKEVGLICLPFNYKEHEFEGDDVTELGWGFTVFNFAERVDSLKKLRSFVVSIQRCYWEIPNLDVKNPKDILCTAVGRSGSCNNDAGGPVMWRNRKNNRWILLGVISLEGCGVMPTVSTRVTSYLDFIESSTPGYTYCKDF